LSCYPDRPVLRVSNGGYRGDCSSTDWADLRDRHRVRRDRRGHADKADIAVGASHASWPAAGYGRVLVNGTSSVNGIVRRAAVQAPSPVGRGPAAVRTGQVSAAAAARAATRRSARAARAARTAGARNRSMLLPRRSLRRAHRPGRPGRAASCPAGRAGSAMTAHLFHACGRLPAVPAAERFPGPDASRSRESASESSWSVFARG